MNNKFLSISSWVDVEAVINRSPAQVGGIDTQTVS